MIAEQVRKLREARGWSAQQLAAEMTKAGVKWERMVVTKLETARRQTLGIDEVLALAFVLGVTPVDLVVPEGTADDEPYAVAPGATFPAGAVREWFAGLGLLAEPASSPDFLEAVRWMPTRRAAALSRTWWTREREQEHTRQTNLAEFPDLAERGHPLNAEELDEAVSKKRKAVADATEG